MEVGDRVFHIVGKSAGKGKIMAIKTNRGKHKEYVVGIQDSNYIGYYYSNHIVCSEKDLVIDNSPEVTINSRIGIIDKIIRRFK